MRFEYEENPAPDGQYKNKILAPGKARYVVETAIEAISKSSGKPMIELTLNVTDQLGETGKVWVYLMHNNPGRIKAFLESAGRSSLYNSSAELRDRDLPGLRGECEIKTQYSTNPQYGDKTVVDHFIVNPTAGATTSMRLDSNPSVHDDVPF
jgi:hypothetical protein